MQIGGARSVWKHGQPRLSRPIGIPFLSRTLNLSDPKTKLVILRNAPRVAQVSGEAPGQLADPSVLLAAAATSPIAHDDAPSTNGSHSSVTSSAPSTSASNTSYTANTAAANNGSEVSNPPPTGSGRSNIRSILRRGYLGELLFMVIGSLICGGLAHWTVGTPLRRFNPYSFTITLPAASGVGMGTPVRMKGVAMGSVLSTRVGLDRVQVEVEVNEAKTIIPRNSRFELTQAGLIPAASIDITPPEGLSADILAAAVAARAAASTDTTVAGSSSSTSSSQPGSGRHRTSSSEGAAAVVEGKEGTTRGRLHGGKAVRLAGPKDVAACRLQGVLVCQGDRLEGLQGGSMDELMGHMLKSLRQGEVEGTGVPGRGPPQG